MKYITSYSYQNRNFPEFRDLCIKYARRYLVIHCSTPGTYEFVGEFDDNVADKILSELKGVTELVEWTDYFDRKETIPFKDRFEEEYNNGDEYRYVEAYNNN